MSAPVDGLFRKEALEANRRPEQDGDVLRLSPLWVDWTWRVVLLAVAGGLLYSALGRIGEYAEGPLVVELDERQTESSTSAGTVSQVRVHPGERVEQGQVLVELHDALEEADLARIERSFELSLLGLLRDPTDRAASASLTSLRSERELAEARVEDRTVWAGHPGVVGDVLVRVGERVDPGQPVVSIVGEGDQLFVTAVLPGRFGPLLRVGMPLFVELTGFRGIELRGTLTEVGDAVVGPDQVRRTLGTELDGSIPVPPGPSLLVRARLPGRTFTAGGEPLSIHHGMTGLAQVEVRTKSFLYTLFPSLEDLW